MLNNEGGGAVTTESLNTALFSRQHDERAAAALSSRRVVNRAAVAAVCGLVDGAVVPMPVRFGLKRGRADAEVFAKRRNGTAAGAASASSSSSAALRHPLLSAADAHPAAHFSTFRATGQLLVLHSIDALGAENLKAVSDLLTAHSGRLQLLCSFDSPNWLSSERNALAGTGGGSGGGGNQKGGGGGGSSPPDAGRGGGGGGGGGTNSPLNNDGTSRSRGTSPTDTTGGGPQATALFGGPAGGGGGGSGGAQPHSRQALTAAAALATAHKFVVIPANSNGYAFMPFIQETCHVSDAALLLEGGTAAFAAAASGGGGAGGGPRTGAGRRAGGGGSVMAADLSALSVSNLIGDTSSSNGAGLVGGTHEDNDEVGADGSKKKNKHPLAHTPMADTIRRVLLSLPQNFSDILRHILELQANVVSTRGGGGAGGGGRRRKGGGVDSGLLDDDDDDGGSGGSDGDDANAHRRHKRGGGAGSSSSSANAKQHAIPIHTIAPFVERRAGIVLTSHRLDAVLRELTSNRMAAYDGATHSVFVQHYQLILALLDEMEERRRKN